NAQIQLFGPLPATFLAAGFLLSKGSPPKAMSNVQPSSFDEFELAAASGNVVPIFRTVSSNSLEPLTAFDRISKGARYAFLLESVEGGEVSARYSFLGANPEMIVRGKGLRTVIETSD